MLGSLRAGATVTPTTTRAHFNTLVHIMTDSGAKVLFASADFAEEAPKLGAEIDGLEHVFLFDTPSNGTRDYDAWLGEQSSARVALEVEAGDIAFISSTKSR